jgi:hypothetical protein
MFDLMKEHELGIREFLSSLDASSLGTAELRRLLDSFASVEKLGVAGKSLLAAELAGRGALAGKGDRSDAHVLADMTGTSVGRARAAIEAGERLTKMPEVSRAARSGLLSESQLAAVSKAVEKNPAAQGRLLGAAARGSLGELRAECARAIAEVEDAEIRRRRFHESRYLKAYSDAEGMRHLEAGGNPEMMAVIEAAIEERQVALFDAALRDGLATSRSACRFDALYELLSEKEDSYEAGERDKSRSKGSDAKVIVRVDHEALVRGRVQGDEICEISGVGPIAVSAVREIIEDGDPFLAAILTKGVEVCKVVHMGRRPNAYQRTALEYLYPTCAARGCQAAVNLQYDHAEDFAANPVTEVSNLDRLCPYHHMMKTRYNGRLGAGVGKRPFVPPTDLRHPGLGKKRGPPADVA